MHGPLRLRDAGVEREHTGAGGDVAREQAREDGQLTDDTYADGVAHGYEVATLRAESRQRIGLPIIRRHDDEGMLTMAEKREGRTLDDRAQ